MAAVMIFAELQGRLVQSRAPHSTPAFTVGPPTADQKSPAKPFQVEKDEPNPKSKPPSRTMVLDGMTYVLIDDRWYPRTEDNVYSIKGEKIYFVDGQRTEEHQVLVAPKPTEVQDSVDAEDLITSVSANPLAVQSPGNLHKMFKTLGKAKARMAERDEVLKALSTAE